MCNGMLCTTYDIYVHCTEHLCTIQVQHKLHNHYKMSAKNISMPEQSHTKSTFGANHVHGEKMCPLLFGAARTLNCTPQDFLTRRASVVHLNGDRRRSLMSLATFANCIRTPFPAASAGHTSGKGFVAWSTISLFTVHCSLPR